LRHTIDELAREQGLEGKVKTGAAIDRNLRTLLRRNFSGDLTAKWREAHMQELLAEMEQQAKHLQDAPSSAGA
jgi:hypothetical protein